MSKDKTININGKIFKEKDLNEKAKSLVLSLEVINEEIQRIEKKLAIAKTARNAYGISLSPNLPEKEAAKNKKKDVVSINNKIYSYEDMNEKAMADIMSISVVDKKIASLESDLAITKTAKNLYSKSLIEEVK